MRKFSFKLVLLFFLPLILMGNASQAIREASAEGKHLFIFFYKTPSPQQKTFLEIVDKLKDQANGLTVCIQDPGERDVVAKFDLTRSPMPFVIVLAPNGAVSGAYARSFTEEQLVGSLTSPGMAACLKSLQEKKLVFLCLLDPSAEAVLKGVKEFREDPQFSKCSEIVMIDPKDTREQAFLKKLSITLPLTHPKICLLAPQGNMITQYEGAVTKERIIADLKNASSCCCGPGGCCPGGCCK